jgi:lipopolysaccharide export LptBFGC system permease protein LptF
MTIIDRYIARQVLQTTFAGVVVLTGVLVLGIVYKELGKLLGEQEVSLANFMKVLTPFMLFSVTYTIPWSFLTAILLVFGRMSADNELISLRMAGVSTVRICLPIFVIAAAFSSFCFVVNARLYPVAKAQMDRMIYDMASADPAALFQAGTLVDQLPGLLIYAGENVDGELRDVRIVRLAGGRRPSSFLFASRARVDGGEGGDDFWLEFDEQEIVVIDEAVDDRAEGVSRASVREGIQSFSLASLREKLEQVKAGAKLSTALGRELQTGVDSATGLEMDVRSYSEALTEYHKRISLALACITFALVGIPLGVTAQRRETSIGFALSLIVAFLYLLFAIIGDNRRGDPEVYPQVLVWLPNVIFGSLGLLLFIRLCRK